MKKIFLLFFFTPVVVFFSCQKSIDPGNQPQNINAKTVLNVSYGIDPLQNMDVYLPADRSVSSTKVLIMIHGGAWESGDKTDLSEYVDTMKIRLPGYAIFNINYRLSINGVNTFPAQENDTKAALQYIVDNAANYLISKKIVLLGVSAGGHLALLQGYKYNTPVVPKAIVSFFGPTDITAMYNDPADPLIPPELAIIVGKTPAQDPALYASSSPVNFVSSSSPPTILLHGGQDPLVKPSQAVTLQAKLQAAGVSNEYVFYPDEGHGWFGPHLTDSFNKIQAFLAANVQ
ncbi:MAG: alpha/beta hydrolase [Bacteroidota bacterium]|nr:alpha/beta hydrolase [Bacteroidota bacterium]